MEKGSIRHGNIETLPRFIRNLRDLRCCDGDAITLECHVEALPEPVIIWEKDGHVLPCGKEFAISYDGIKATLSIPRVYPEDEGEYTCVAKNNIGRALSSACIIVDVPEEKENMLNRQLTRPSVLLSASSTPRSTPRSTPNRSFSPMRLSYRNSSIDIGTETHGSSISRMGTSRCQAISAPKFYAIPHSRVVEEGDSVRFQCSIAGHPTPWSTWDKDGMIVTPTTRISVKEIDDMRFIDIEEVTFDDAGLYRITLENDYGRIEATARLDVIGRGRYSKSPSVRGIRASSSKRNTYLRRRIMGPSTAIGGRMALATGFRGSSVPACKFYHNGLELDECDRVHIEIDEDFEARLYVENVTLADEGVYTFVIETSDGSISSSTVVHFARTEQEAYYLNESTAPIIKKDLPKILTSRERETIDLCFELESVDPYSYIWMRNGEILPDGNDFNYIDHGNGVLCLRINDAFDIDSGVYACVVTTIGGLTCSTSGELSVLEEEYSEIERESIVLLKSPLPVIASFGTAATFCAKVHPRDADVNWFVCGRSVCHTVNGGGDSHEFTLESSAAEGLRFLHIHNADYTHSGEILLTVTHPGRKTPTVRTSTSLLVFPAAATATDAKNAKLAPNQLQVRVAPPVPIKQIVSCEKSVPAYILESPEDCTALIGGSVRLSVQFEGVPHPAVKWFKAGRPISVSANISISTQSERSTLFISDIVTDDSGKYTVEVMNEWGDDIAAASVAVEGPPEPPSGKPSISKGPDRLSLAWCGPPYDGGCMLTGFIIEMQQLSLNTDDDTDDVECTNYDDNDVTWLEIATVVDSLAYTVKNLIPGRAYRFRVRAENIHGRSEPSLASDHVKLLQPEILTEDFSTPISVKPGGDFRNRFEILEELGKGRFGVVYKVQEKETNGQVLAAKVIKCIKSRDKQKVQEEISIMKSLQHPKLLQLAAAFESSREIVMVMEFITGGELFERVVADDFTLTERDCILFLQQVCEGVHYMHSQSIVHLDLKPENIMCHTRTSHQIKIIDFGLAQRLNTNTPVRVLFGTPEFIPPEIISYEPIGFQSDMWSVGVICYVLLSGLSPFMGDSDVETYANITRADYDFDDEAFDCVSQEAKDFISNLLIHRKENRWTAKQCLESEWLNQTNDETLINNRICTDKLKRFIIRRKWQKTGNAIRALGRMATLSASRRNSAVSTGASSLPSSPRPSISGVSMINPHSNNKQMTSLHEEDDDFSTELPSVELNKIHMRCGPLKVVRDKTYCSERSDSGYSECSNCSNSGNSASHCVQSILVDVALKENVSQEIASDQTLLTDMLSIAVPHDVLKNKLENVATSKEENAVELILNEPTLEELDDNHNNITAGNRPEVKREQEYKNWASEDSMDTLRVLVVDETVELSATNSSPTAACSVTREPILRSDFTNTIQMRKKSLENNVSRDKAVKQPKIIFESSGKVSMLKSKFSHPPASTAVVTNQKHVSSAAEKSSNNNNNNNNNYDSRDFGTKANVFDRLACNNKTTTGVTTKTQSISMPNSPLPVRSNTPIRLSGRVKEATERLSQQHTFASARRTENKKQSASEAKTSTPVQTNSKSFYTQK